VGPIDIQARTSLAATRDIVRALLSGAPLRVAFANTHLLYCAIREPEFARGLRSFYIVNDGVGIALLARLACGVGFHENLNGTDFTPRLLSALPWGTRVFLVGARPEIVQRAAHEIARRWPQLDVCGCRDGFEGSEQALLELEALDPALILVAMGNPSQEQWILRATERRPGTIFVGVGALFDFLTGAAPRAPRLWQRLRLEWAFRLLHEPRRLWRRYTIEVLVVLATILRTPRPRRA
jgi:exopolysaccharide biosynthesis WecB/TagA/CpsF family protein